MQKLSKNTTMRPRKISIISVEFESRFEKSSFEIEGTTLDASRARQEIISELTAL